MDTTTAQVSIKNLWGEAFSLTPTALITLFEVDFSQLAFDLGISLSDSESVFRFHSNVKLLNTSIFWQGNEYIAAPVQASGFEVTSKGTLPLPRLAISVRPEGIPILGVFKSSIQAMGDLSGAIVTRRRTFARFLDARNFYQGTAPKNFTPDPNSEFPPDVFYIDRKSTENKAVIEFELASILDIKGIKLPNRLVLSNRCSFDYRGQGCLYENAADRVESTHGSPADSILPVKAPAVANVTDELITSIITPYSIVYRGQWNPNSQYLIGSEIWIMKAGIKYHFVARVSNQSIPPPNLGFWLPDNCSKSIDGCKLRYGTSGAVVVNFGQTKGDLYYGGFPGANRQY